MARKLPYLKPARTISWRAKSDSDKAVALQLSWILWMVLCGMARCTWEPNNSQWTSSTIMPQTGSSLKVKIAETVWVIPIISKAVLHTIKYQLRLLVVRTEMYRCKAKSTLIKSVWHSKHASTTLSSSSSPVSKDSTSLLTVSLVLHEIVHSIWAQRMAWLEAPHICLPWKMLVWSQRILSHLIYLHLTNFPTWTLASQSTLEANHS